MTAEEIRKLADTEKALACTKLRTLLGIWKHDDTPDAVDDLVTHLLNATMLYHAEMDASLLEKHTSGKQ